MQNDGRMTLKQYVIFIFLFFISRHLFAEKLFENEAEPGNSLRDHGFENIVISERSDSVLAVYYENRLYRDELYAAAVIMALLDSLSIEPSTVVLVPSRRALPVCELRIDRRRYKEFINKGDTEEKFISVTDVGQASPFWPTAFTRPSFGRIDLTVYPTFSVYLGNYDDRFKLFFALMPVVSTTLWKGAAIYIEASIPLYNDVNYQYFRFIDYPQLSKAAVNQTLRLPYNIMASVSFGLFNPNRWGWGGEVNKLFFNRHLSIGYSFEYTGFLLYYDKVWNYSKMGLLTSKAYAWYYSNFLNCQFGVSYNKYVMKDSGWLFEFSRNFRETTVGFFAGSTQIDKFGGLSLRFPFSRRVRAKPRVVRAVLPRYYEYSYRATNKVYTQHSPVQTGISVYTGTKLTYLYMHLTPNYVANNLQVFRMAYKSIHRKNERGDEEENLRRMWQKNK